MTIEQIVGLIFTIGGVIISALAIIVYRQYTLIYGEKKEDFDKLKEKIEKTAEVEKIIEKLEKTNNLFQQIINEFKNVVNDLQQRMAIEEFKLQTFDETNNKIVKQIEEKLNFLNKKLEFNTKKIAELGLEIKIMKKDIEE